MDAVLTLSVAGSRRLQEVMLLGPHDRNGWMAGRVRQRSRLKDVNPKGTFKPREPSQMCLIDLVSPRRPSVGLVNNPHPLEHQQTQMFTRLLQLPAQLCMHSASFTDEGWGDMDPRIREPSPGRQPTAKRFTHTNTSNVIRGATGKKRTAIQGEAVQSKATQMLCVIALDTFMTAHAAALPGPDATPTPGVGKARPTIWEEESEHSKASVR